jgi:hypothetical protein
MWRTLELPLLTLPVPCLPDLHMHLQTCDQQQQKYQDVLRPPNAQDLKEKAIIKKEVEKIEAALTLQEEILMLQKELGDLNTLKKL